MAFNIVVDAGFADVLIGMRETYTDDDGAVHERTVEFSLPPVKARAVAALILDRADKVGRPPVDTGDLHGGGGDRR